MTSETFEQLIRWPFKIPTTFINRMTAEKTVYKVPVPFCCTQKVNDARYFSKYKTLAIMRTVHPRQINISF